MAKVYNWYLAAKDSPRPDCANKPKGCPYKVMELVERHFYGPVLGELPTGQVRRYTMCSDCCEGETTHLQPAP